MDAALANALVNLTRATPPGALLFGKERLSPQSLAAFEEWVRNNRDPEKLRNLEIREALRGASPRSLNSHLRHHPDAFGLAAICSYSESGYVRAAALPNLARSPDLGLAYLLWRTCDWVPQVADQAKALLQSMLVQASDLALIESLPTLVQINSKGYELPHGAFDQLRSRPNLLSNLGAALGADEQTLLTSNAVFGPDEDWIKVLIERATCGYQRVQRAAIRQLRHQDQAVVFSSIDQLWTGPVSARLLALSLAAEHGRDDLLNKATLDKNWTVRSRARHHLKAKGIEIGIDWYRQHLPKPSSILGFGEVANEGELVELLPFCELSSPRVRRAALLCLANRRADFAEERFITALSDSSRPVIRVAIQGLSNLSVHLSRETFEQARHSQQDPLNIKLVEKALSLLPHWEFLHETLRLSSDQQLQTDVESLLTKWIQNHPRSYAFAAPDQLASIEESFAKVRDGLPQPLARRLEQEIQAAKRATSY